MKPSILNGRDIGTLEFNNFITFRPRQKVKYSSMESQINFIFNNIKYDYLYYSWEKDKEYNHYHTHILLKINQPDLENYLYTNIKGYSNICKSERELMLRYEKNFTNIQENLKGIARELQFMNKEETNEDKEMLINKDFKMFEKYTVDDVVNPEDLKESINEKIIFGLEDANKKKS